MAARIHATADVSEKAEIGEGTSIWNYAQVREGARIGRNCILSKGVYVDAGVQIGDNCKLQNNVSVYHGVVIEDGVFVGPHVCFTNDVQPRAINPDGTFKERQRLGGGRDAGGLRRSDWRKQHHSVRHCNWQVGHDWRGQRGDERCAGLWAGVWQPGQAAWVCLCVWRKA